MCGLATPLLAGMSGEPLVVSTQAQLWAESSWVPVAGVRGTLARVAAGGGPGSLGGTGGVPEELHGHGSGRHEPGTDSTDGLLFLRGYMFTRGRRRFGQVEIKRRRIQPRPPDPALEMFP